MIAATVVATVFVVVVTITWLSSRAESSEARCEVLTEHIHQGLEPKPPRRDRAGRPARAVRSGRVPSPGPNPPPRRPMAPH